MRVLSFILVMMMIAGSVLGAKDKTAKAGKPTREERAARAEKKANKGKDRIPVILDTDIGDDIDDTWALAVLLGNPKIDLKLIVTATDDTPAKARLVAKILDRLGRTDIPIGIGVKQKDKGHNQMQWLGDFSLDTYKGKVYEDGVQALIDTIKAAPGQVTLCVLGPQTNIGEALKRDPSIAQKARVVSMFGSVYKGYNGADKPSPEYNVRRDVAAAQAVFAAPWAITIAPLDSCGTLQLKGKAYTRIQKSQAPRAGVVIENYDQWKNRAKYAADSSSVLFDTLAAILCFDESMCEMKTVKLSVDEKGMTVPDEEKGRPVNCALDFKDREGVEKLIARNLTGPKSAEEKATKDGGAAKNTADKKDPAKKGKKNK